MIVICWSHNNEPEYQKEVRAYTSAFLGGAKLMFRNPMFFKPSQVEQCDIVIFKGEEWPDILTEYQRLKADPKSGMDPQIITSITAAPKFKIVPIDDPEKKPEEDLESADLGLMPGKAAPKIFTDDLGEGGGEGFEAGSLSQALSSIVADLGDAPKDLTEPGDTKIPHESLAPRVPVDEKQKAKAKPKKSGK